MADLLADARVDAGQVMDIISTELAAGQINAFINTAHLLVDAKLASRGLGDDLLEQIELWLSAHFLSMRDQRAESERIGSEYQVTYQGKTDMGLKATIYGQQALALDWSGTLSSLGKQRAVIQVIRSPDDA